MFCAIARMSPVRGSTVTTGRPEVHAVDGLRCVVVDRTSAARWMKGFSVV